MTLDNTFYPIAGCPTPVFRQDLAELHLFYAPGYLAVTGSGDAQALTDQLCAPSPSLFAATRLRERSQAATQRWSDIFGEKPFAPLCLTLYTSHRCNLQCSYCFSQGEAGPEEADLDLSLIRQAAEEVAENCQKAGVPFTLVIHGGGEPTLDPRLPDILAAADEAAARRRLSRFHYLATNGVMSAEQAQWAIRNFDEIGLSCDGPADIQAAQRPLRNGSSSAALVERTAAIIRGAGKTLTIRATITAQSLERMPEIAAYLCGSLRAQAVRIEPVFRGGRTQAIDGIPARLAERFAAAFLQARRVASSFGASWTTTGCRLGEIHGRYCQVFRDVLHLVPGDGISACFKMSSRSQARTAGLEIGAPAGTGVPVDPNRVWELRRTLAADDPACQACVNRFHCTRGCPDRCPVTDSSTSPAGLRCELNRLLTAALLRERAEKLKPLLGQHPVIGTTIEGFS